MQAGLHVADLDGLNTTNRSKWRTTVTITVLDANQIPVANAKVFGIWSYGNSTNCTTAANGQCSLVSNEFEADQVGTIAFTVNNVTHNMLPYQAAGNSDPDGDSSGTTISVNKPVPSAMYIADLDQVTSVNGSKWRTTVTITVLDANQDPVAAAKVFGLWSYGDAKDCTTDASGRCSLTSNEFEAAQVETIAFTVNNVSHEEVLIYSYQAAGNADPDGDSNGTTITLNKPSPTPIRVADLDGSSALDGGSEWRATVTISVLDANQSPVVNAKVLGIWGNGKAVNCTTDSSGWCSLTSDKFKLIEVSSISFNVDGVTHEEVLVYAYQAVDNTDPDGDSNGTAITVNKPF